MKKYDAIIIGTGQAGPTLASRLAGAGYKTAIIERSRFGGTCVNYGCTPTKTMVASAKVAYLARRGTDFGVLIGDEVKIDMARVNARKDAIVTKSTEGIEKWLTGTDNIDVYKTHARFEGPRTIRVGDDVIEGERVYLNVGTRARVPDIPGVKDVDYQTNVGMLQMEYVPEHLVVVGGSYVGLEFGQMFRRFGSNVTIVEMGQRLLPREDADVCTAVTEILQAEDIDVRLAAECIALAKTEDGVAVSVDCNDETETVNGSHVLLAVGRVPNTDHLGLDKAGISVDDRGFIPVDDELRTNVEGVYALGDVNRRGAFTHTSYNDHEIIADNLLHGDNRRVSDRIFTAGLFIDPPLARVGMNENEARLSGRNVLMGTRAMTRVSRAVEKGESQGFMKVLVDADTKEILGATILGVDGDEAIHAITDIMYAKAPYTVIQRAVHIHPTVAELIPTVLGDLKPLE